MFYHYYGYYDNVSYDNSMEKSAHNSRFLACEGRLKGGHVKALLYSIERNNIEYEDRQICYNISDTTTPVANPKRAPKSSKASKVEKYNNMNMSKKIENNKTYYVTFDYSDSGFISGVEIHLYSDNDPQEVKFTDL